ncbi:MAG TPA: hypothetical protein VF178_05710 [Gemmatimonadaceae bacterium]
MRIVVALMALSVLACGGGPAPEGAPRPTRGSPNLITEEEIAAGTYETALDAIRGLRPTMLIARGTSMTQSSSTPGVSEPGAASVGIVAYLDGVRLNDLSALSTIPAARVREIRFLNARDATTRYGSGHGSGAIVVVSKK